VKIQCGAMHTLALGSDGSLWTWGCNDDGSLGRDGAENVPMKVESLPIPVDGIAAGDCHSVAYSTSTNQVYIWGCYRVSKSSRFVIYDKTPQKSRKLKFINSNVTNIYKLTLPYDILLHLKPFFKILNKLLIITFNYINDCIFFQLCIFSILFDTN
jgi:regulator of chromosome condensation